MRKSIALTNIKSMRLVFLAALLAFMLAFGMLPAQAFANPTSFVTTPQIATGHAHTVALKSDGTVWTWGYNGYAQLGLDPYSIYQSAPPVQVSGLSAVVSVAAGQDHTVALKSDGTVWAWGDNSSGQLGMNPSSVQQSATPVQVSGLSNIVSVAAGDCHTVALKSDGTVWAWGDNSSGQLGMNPSSVQQSATPVQVSGLSDVIFVDANYYHTMVVKSDGTVWAWGDNYFGQLGIDPNSIQQSATPVQVSGLSDVVSIDTNRNHSVALKSDGTVWAWGIGYYYVTGEPSATNNPLIPHQMGDLDDVVSVSVGDYTAIVVKSDGTVWAWGYNAYGMLGVETTSLYQSTVPIQISSLSDVVSVAAGIYPFAVALKSDGTVWTWGENSAGSLGVELSTPNQCSTTPLQILNFNLGATTPPSPDPQFLKAKVSAGLQHSLALKSDGTVLAWGENGKGQLGNGTKITSSIPVAVQNLTDVISVSAGYQHSMALKSDGTVWVWGANANGQLGLDNNTPSTSPVQVTALSDVIAIAAGENHSAALKSDGTVWAWGANGKGQLGNNTTTQCKAPVQVTGLSDVVALTASAKTSAALKSDGTVWTWGDNASGQLGNNKTGNSKVPVQVPVLSNVSALVSGGSHTLALQSNGTVWAWGGNASGQLGNNTTTDSRVPLQVSGLSNAVSLDAGDGYSAVLTADGTIWNWGSATSGHLGSAAASNSTVPVQVTGLSDAAFLSGSSTYSLVIKSNGTVWAWGDNASGQLGNGTTSNSATPVQVSGVMLM